MKTFRRLALVFALTLGAAACTTSIVAPDGDDDTYHLPGSGNHNPGSGN